MIDVKQIILDFEKTSSYLQKTGVDRREADRSAMTAALMNHRWTRVEAEKFVNEILPKEAK